MYARKKAVVGAIYKMTLEMKPNYFHDLFNYNI